VLEDTDIAEPLDVGCFGTDGGGVGGGELSLKHLRLPTALFFSGPSFPSVLRLIASVLIRSEREVAERVDLSDDGCLGELVEGVDGENALLASDVDSKERAALCLGSPSPSSILRRFTMVLASSMLRRFTSGVGLIYVL
jgi:hypothetical protein